MAACRIAQAFLRQIATIFHRPWCQYADGMKKPEKPSLAADADKFMIRLPEGMRERIAEAAKTNGRSMNAEVVARLEKSLEGDGASLKEVPDAMLYQEIARRAGENFSVEIAIKSKT